MDPADLDVITTYMEMTGRPTRPTVPCPPGNMPCCAWAAVGRFAISTA
jgi:hypothetical protein